MTRLVEQALTEIHKLPEPEQDAIVALLLDELADERRRLIIADNSPGGAQ